MYIKILDKFGTRCIASQDGQALYDLIHPALSENQRVDIDFGGVDIFASPFFNYSFGQLFNVLSQESLRENLHVTGENEIGRIIIERVIENSLIFRDKNVVLDAINKVFEK